MKVMLVMSCAGLLLIALLERKCNGLRASIISQQYELIDSYQKASSLKTELIETLTSNVVVLRTQRDEAFTSYVACRIGVQ